jgi:hypothetical protein
MQTTCHYKPRFRSMRMPIRIARDLNLYLIMDNKHMKRIDVDYNVRVGYWASRNDMQETKSMSL